MVRKLVPEGPCDSPPHVQRRCRLEGTSLRPRGDPPSPGRGPARTRLPKQGALFSQFEHILFKMARRGVPGASSAPQSALTLGRDRGRGPRAQCRQALCWDLDAGLSACMAGLAWQAVQPCCRGRVAGGSPATSSPASNPGQRQALTVRQRHLRSGWPWWVGAFPRRPGSRRAVRTGRTASDWRLR